MTFNFLVLNEIPNIKNNKDTNINTKNKIINDVINGMIEQDPNKRLSLNEIKNILNDYKNEIVDTFMNKNIDFLDPIPS